MCKLPMFGETSIDEILAELDAVNKAHLENHHRLMGFDNFAQSTGTAWLFTVAFPY